MGRYKLACVYQSPGACEVILFQHAFWMDPAGETAWRELFSMATIPHRIRVGLERLPDEPLDLPVVSRGDQKPVDEV